MRAYSQYKNSEIEWLGDIPKEWNIKKIKWMTSIKRGASPRPIDDPKYFDDNGEYAWVRIADVSSAGMYLEKTTQRVSDLGASLSVKREPGDIFVSIAGTVGKPCITNIKCCIHDGFVYFPDYSGDKKYLYYVFASGEPYKGLGKMGTQLNLNTETIGSIKIPDIPLMLQYKIASFLDKKTEEIDALLILKNKQIEMLEQQRQSIITEAVTKGLNSNVKMKDSGVEWIGEIPEDWKLTKIKYVSSLLNGDRGENYPSGNDFVDEGVPFITSHNLNSRYVDELTLKYISKERYNLLRGIKIKKNDIIYCLRGSVGKNALVTNDGGTIASSLMGIRANKKVNAEFLSYILNSKMEVWNRSMLTTGSVSDNLSAENVGTYLFTLPDLNEQLDIVNYLNEEMLKLEKLMLIINRQIEKLKEYRQALIYEAVTGKIDVRDIELD
ncbi:restriction endonuclease subunit S [Metasolibacillus sp. FSL H7-0170]|uniref:restriction endonuclease subunit S n=1 Tax=Metasolibacillus sp. FSL H7-0170 TaxID=2921431 RepID=UPI0031593C14